MSAPAVTTDEPRFVGAFLTPPQGRAPPADSFATGFSNLTSALTTAFASSMAWPLLTPGSAGLVPGGAMPLLSAGTFRLCDALPSDGLLAGSMSLEGPFVRST